MAVTTEATPPPATPDAQLAQARAKIDGVDSALLGLIGERSEAVAALAVAKDPSGSPLRPAREAALLRRLLAQAPSGVEPDTLIWVWRGLIASSIRKQKPIEVIAAGGHDAVRHLELARLHFGPGAKITRDSDVRSALSRVAAAEAKDVAAVTPWPGSSGPGMWWPALTEGRFQGLSVVAMLPMRGEPEAALVTTGAPLEPSGANDHTLIVGFDQRFRLDKALAEAGVQGKLLARANASVLVQAEGFVSPHEDRFKALQLAGLDGARVVGAFSPL